MSIPWRNWGIAGLARWDGQSSTWEELTSEKANALEAQVARLQRENTDLHELVDHWRQRALKAEGEAGA